MENDNKSLYSILNLDNSYMLVSFPNFSNDINVSKNVLEKIKNNKDEILIIINNWNKKLNMNSFIFVEFLSYKSIIFHLKKINNSDYRNELSIEIFKEIKNKEVDIDKKMINEWVTILDFQKVLDNSFIFQYLDLYIDEFDENEIKKIIEKLDEIFIKMNFWEMSNNKKVRNKWLDKFFSYDDICYSFGFRKIIEFLYEYKNKNLSNEERKNYKKYVSIVCDQIIKTEAKKKM